jgi:hypothetical protein
MSEQDEGIGGADRKGGMSTGARVGLAAAIGLGALASGLLLTRPGRRLVADVFRGGRRSTVESRVLDSLWADRVLGGRHIEVAEISPGRVVLRGRVANRDEVGRAVAIAERAKGVIAVVEELEVGKKRG